MTYEQLVILEDLFRLFSLLSLLVGFIIVVLLQATLISEWFEEYEKELDYYTSGECIVLHKKEMTMRGLNCE